MKYVNHKGSTVEINGVDSQLKMACDAENEGKVELSKKHLTIALLNELLGTDTQRNLQRLQSSNHALAGLLARVELGPIP